MNHTSRNGKTGHVRILQLNVADIYPSPENEQLYRPVTADDPEVQVLAESIRQHGIREPLVITEDSLHPQRPPSLRCRWPGGAVHGPLPC